MLVFIDESGDSGLKIDKGSSKYFTVALVAFEDNEEATACDQRINLLKRELGWKENEEFHFNKNSNETRKTFLKAVLPYNFFYYGIIINKDPQKLWGEGFKNKESFYKYACGLVFNNAKEKLINAIVIMDKSGNSDFRNKLSKYLKTKANEGGIKKVKMEDSHRNNLVQLSDYIAGAVNRSMQQHKRDCEEYRKIISSREIYVQIWPR
jgi:hypothetical protein